MSDPQKYRTKDEVADWMEQDPIEHVLSVIKSNKWLSEKELNDIDAWVKNEVDESVTFAENSPYPDASELYKDVYVQADYPFIKEY
jgi:pyruvate dehydrogenase E1 component alpha subunit